MKGNTVNEILSKTLVGFCFYLVFDFFAMGIIEYVAHRWFMHRPNPFNMFGYKKHHVEHHGMGLNDYYPHIDLRFRDMMVFASPFLLWSAVFGTIAGRQWGYYYPYGAIPALMLVVWIHNYVYTRVHRCVHELEHNWTERLPGFQEMKRHHLDHHRRPNRNFSVVFLWTDRLFGTYWRSPEEGSTRGSGAHADRRPSLPREKADRVRPASAPAGRRGDKLAVGTAKSAGPD